ncbi:hypothetical protein MTO96_025560 [Rhipicephalus appendiculatus]
MGTATENSSKPSPSGGSRTAKSTLNLSTGNGANTDGYIEGCHEPAPPGPRPKHAFIAPVHTKGCCVHVRNFLSSDIGVRRSFPSSWLQVLRLVMSRNRKLLTLGEKLRIIEEAEKRKGATKASIARDLNIPESSLKTILAKKDSILLNASKFGLNRKAAKDGKYAAMEKALVKWLRQARSSGIAVDGAILKEKAEIIALCCGIDDFKASNGCCCTFRFEIVSIGHGVGIEQNVAFQHSKELTTKAPVLEYFNSPKPVILTVDTSPYDEQAVLAHRDKAGQERPLSFASRRFYAAEQRYSQAGEFPYAGCPHTIPVPDHTP